jgi:hypothetical protein
MKRCIFAIEGVKYDSMVFKRLSLSVIHKTPNTI